MPLVLRPLSLTNKLSTKAGQLGFETPRSAAGLPPDKSKMLGKAELPKTDLVSKQGAGARSCLHQASALVQEECFIRKPHGGTVACVPFSNTQNTDIERKPHLKRFRRKNVKDNLKSWPSVQLNNLLSVRFGDMPGSRTSRSTKIPRPREEACGLTCAAWTDA